MSGKTDLNFLLRNMQPLLASEEYVFCSIQRQDWQSLDLNPIATFKEKEGLTLILTEPEADSHNLSYSGTFRMITLEVHSSLEAVGFMAAIASLLAKHNISVNPISGYYHDHLFVPTASSHQAMSLLQEYSQSFSDR